MKIIPLTGLSLLIAGSVLAGPAGRGADQKNRACDGPCRELPVATTTSLNLSESARAALRFQIDEERMAGDLYRALGQLHDARPFQNIPTAEDRHQSMLRDLASRAGVTVAADQPAGRYATAAVQERYDLLLARGRVSLTEALAVGALVEEQDIADLRTLAATTDSPDLKAVVSALEQASVHHLGAFVRNLRSQGVDYAAQVLTPAEVAKMTSRGRS